MCQTVTWPSFIAVVPRGNFTVHPPVAIVVWFDCYHSFCDKSAPLYNTGHERSVITSSRRQLHSRRRGHTQWSWNVSYTAFDVQKDDSYTGRRRADTGERSGWWTCRRQSQVLHKLTGELSWPTTSGALQPCSSWTEIQMLIA